MIERHDHTYFSFLSMRECGAFGALYFNFLSHFPSQPDSGKGETRRKKRGRERKTKENAGNLRKTNESKITIT